MRLKQLKLTAQSGTVEERLKRLKSNAPRLKSTLTLNSTASTALQVMPVLSDVTDSVPVNLSVWSWSSIPNARQQVINQVAGP
jgi:hypothetical protein